MTIPSLKEIQLLLLDVDGVLTAGEIIYTDSGEQVKIFNAKDGLGIRLLQQAGLQVGIVTGRSGQALRHRCANLGIELIFDGTRDKAAVLPQIEERTGLPTARMAFIGDDLPDLAIMKRVGVPIAVADAHELIRRTAMVVTRAPGGRGAVREACERILKAQDRWDALLEQFHE